MTQNEAVILTLEELGGIATLGQLNQEIFKIKDCEWKAKNPFANIRRVVQLHKDIYKIKPGLYALLKYKKELETKGIIQETDKNKDAEVIKEFNHSYYQGLVLTIGNLKNFKTYLPNQDKNKIFINQKLGELSTIDSIPDFSYRQLVQRSSTIDIIWFNERLMPHSFFEVEHKGDFQNSLVKLNDLQDFYSRMIIIADKKRKSEFETKKNYSALKDIKSRIQFLDYESLAKQYEQIIESKHFSFLI